MARQGGVPVLQGLWSAMAALFQPWVPARAPRKVHLTSLPLTEEDLGKMRIPAGRVSLVLPASACLERDVTLPRAARAKAAQAISLNLRGSLPSGGKGLIWRHRPASEPGATLVYRCALVKEAHLTQLREAAAGAGVKVADIRLPDYPGVGFDAPVLWQAMPNLPTTAKNWAAATGLVCILLALLVIVLTEAQVAKVSEQVSVRSARVTQLEQRLAEAEAQEARGTADAVLTATQIVDFRNGLRPLSGLGLVAAGLPPDVWISELSIAAGGWRLSGFASGEVTETVTALQALPGAGNVRLSGPVMFDTYSQKSRFDIEMTLLPESVP